MLTKCKTCLVMQDNQQVKSNFISIYIVILAAYFFHVFMILAAQFDLKLTQYNIINIFMHANLNEIIFMKMSDKYQKIDHILKLNKTLYRLQKFSLLWQQKLKKILLHQKFREISHEFCCMTQNSILVFFYIDDISLVRPDPETWSNPTRTRPRSRFGCTWPKIYTWQVSQILNSRPGSGSGCPPGCQVLGLACLPSMVFHKRIDKLSIQYHYWYSQYHINNLSIYTTIQAKILRLILIPVTNSISKSQSYN